MDAVVAWRPWDAKHPSWRPQTEGLHVDQNPFDKPDFCCVQGMVPLYDATAATGGLEVVPGTHLPKAQATIRA